MGRRVIRAALALMMGGALRPAAAQVPAEHPRSNTVPLVLAGTMGSFAGLVGGALYGERLGWGGGDDPGLWSALVFSQVGSVLGAATAVELASCGNVPALRALGGSVLGSMVGLAGTFILASTFDEVFGDGSIWIGYAVGHGLVAGTIAARSRP